MKRGNFQNGCLFSLQFYSVVELLLSEKFCLHWLAKSRHIVNPFFVFWQLYVLIVAVNLYRSTKAVLPL